MEQQHFSGQAEVDDALRARFCQKMVSLTQATPRIELMIRPQDAWVLLSFLQLALRHPEAAQARSAVDARRLARRLQSLIASPGSAAEEIAERGWQGE